MITFSSRPIMAMVLPVSGSMKRSFSKQLVSRYKLTEAGLVSRWNLIGREPASHHSKAETAGFRPCKRCSPRSASPQQQQAETIATICQRIEAAETPLSLDAMAQMAGLELEARLGNWNGEPFTSTSGKHISVWRKASA